MDAGIPFACCANALAERHFISSGPARDEFVYTSAPGSTSSSGGGGGSSCTIHYTISLLNSIDFSAVKAST
jgi:hypothetical protein